MFAAVAVTGARVTSVRLQADEPAATEQEGEATTTAAESGTVVPEDPSPLAIELKELAWSFGPFLVLLLLMRLWLYPRVKSTMDARQALIDNGLAEAESVKAAAQAEVADYQAALAEVRSEGQDRIDAAAKQVEGERQAKLVEVNAAIAERKSAAVAEVEAAKAAVASRVADAASDVVNTAAGHVLGLPPSGSTVSAAVQRAMSAGVAR
jgi:F-type H+-transporting ATPase subunit b